MSSLLSKLINLAGQITGTLPVANGGTGVTSSTGSGSVVLSTSPTLVTPALGTPTSGTLSNCTGYPVVVPGTSAGLVSASGVPVNATGSAIASTFVGYTTSISRLRSAATSLGTSNNIVNVCSTNFLTITKGIWQVSGYINFTGSSAATTLFSASVCATSGSIPATDTIGVPNSTGEVEVRLANVNLSSADVTVPITPYTVVCSSASQNLYLTAFSTFSAGSVSVNGYLEARQIA